MKANIVVDISPPIPCLVILVLDLWGEMLKTNLQKSVGDEIVFLPADKHKSFL